MERLWQWWRGYWPGGSGLVCRHGKLAYGCGHGFGRYWLPYPFLRLVTRLWNHVACRWLGHEWMPEVKGLEFDAERDCYYVPTPPQAEFCPNCCAKRTVKQPA